MKNERQSKIIELISKHDISTQTELTEYLVKAGFQATQATVSRDIKLLQLEKVPKENGKGTKYYFPASSSADQDKYLRVLKEGFTNVERAGTIVVIRTVSGMAMAVAAALDSCYIKENIGSIAGDDTIFCATKSEKDAQSMIDKIKAYLKD